MWINSGFNGNQNDVHMNNFIKQCTKPEFYWIISWARLLKY